MDQHHQHQIYQIYYNKQTQQSNDPGFRGLDNLQNARPDWSEYWPIRDFLLSNEMREDCYYGFFSPKFKEKTGLNSQAVYSFLDHSDQDIVAFSPYFDQSAFFFNMFEQGAANHPTIWPCIEASFKLINPSIEPSTLVMSSKQTIFCNYFAAKKHVWLEWLTQCEKLFAVAEDGRSELAQLLNGPVSHSGSHNPAKVFITERVISYLIATQTNWSVRVYNPMALPVSGAPIAKYCHELTILDALKIAFRETGQQEYLNAFETMRTDVIAHIQSR
jgi:hypothetical protein